MICLQLLSSADDDANIVWLSQLGRRWNKHCRRPAPPGGRPGVVIPFTAKAPAPVATATPPPACGCGNLMIVPTTPDAVKPQMATGQAPPCQSTVAGALGTMVLGMFIIAAGSLIELIRTRQRG